MAVILQTRCFQMDDYEPDLSFSKYVELDWGGGGGGGLKRILAIYTLSIFCEIPIRWIQHLTGH